MDEADTTRERALDEVVARIEGRIKAILSTDHASLDFGTPDFDPASLERNRPLSATSWIAAQKSGKK